MIFGACVIIDRMAIRRLLRRLLRRLVVRFALAIGQSALHRISIRLIMVALICSLASATEPPVTAIAIAPNDEIVLSGSQEGIMRHTWPNLDPMDPLSTELTEVHDIQFSPDGSSVAAAGGHASEQGIVEVFQWPSGKLLSRKRYHDDTIESVVWIDDDSFATASLDTEVARWRIDGEYPHQRLIGHSKGVVSLEALPQNRILLTGSIDQTIRVWDLQRNQIVRTLDNHTAAIHTIRVRPTREGLPMIATTSDDRTVRFWQPTIGRMVRFCRLRATPLSACWTKTGDRLLVGCSDGDLRIIDPETARILETRKGIDGWIYVVQRRRDGDQFVIGGSDGELVSIQLDDEGSLDD